MFVYVFLVQPSRMACRCGSLMACVCRNFDCNDNQGVLPVSAPGIAEMTEENDALSSFRCIRQ